MTAKSILLVEDEAMIAMMMEDFLEELGYRLHGVAATVADAREMASEGDFDAAVLDCNLQGEKVWEVADILIDRSIPFLFATGGSMGDVPTRYADRPTLAKPFTIGSVERVLAAMIGDR